MASPAGRVNSVILAFTVASGAVVFLRLFTRVFVIRNAGFEELCITLAMAFSIGLTVLISEQIRNGLGMHIYDLTPAMMINSQKAFWGSIWVYYLALTFTKISILAQYLRIFPSPRFRAVCCIVLAFVVGFGFWGLFGSIFLCMPVQFFWDKTVQNGECLNQFVVWFLNAGINILQDFTILILPMPLLRRLNVPKPQKRALIAIFALGGFVCLISIIRLHSLVRISNSSDPTFDNPPAATLSAVETNVGIVCACLPSIRPLLSAILPAYFPPTARFTNVVPNDEERPRHTRKDSASTCPLTASTRPYTPHSSTRTYSGSNTTETYKQRATIYETGTKVNGPIRQVTISSTKGLSPFDGVVHRLPQLPENMAVLGAVDTIGQQARHSRNVSQYRFYRSSQALQIRRTHMQKPLPLTPLPGMEPWFWNNSGSPKAHRVPP
ncbi:hypothetical protein CC78DRAFT_582671 [Lojkania enalia]|uniref:Rhodopsin domain-containing protein n=1 Tax=Lojkania enalia TaxID=147567 RepID=A0A9P4K694_9PLEO|nr:hypothetical protein CC78DRAFT_582671 [Didymosphaeria enalia]